MSAAPDYTAIIAGPREKLRKALLAGAPTAELHRQIETAEERLEQAAKAAQQAAATRLPRQKSRPAQSASMRPRSALPARPISGCSRSRRGWRP